MSTFYVLPPRPLLAQQCARFLGKIFPGLDWDDGQQHQLVETLGYIAGRQSEVFVVFREELPDGVEPAQALIEDFGAAPGDDVIEVAASGVRRWQIERLAA
jgi:hypothetical protein